MKISGEKILNNYFKGKYLQVMHTKEYIKVDKVTVSSNEHDGAFLDIRDKNNRIICDPYVDEDIEVKNEL